MIQRYTPESAKTNYARRRRESELKLHRRDLVKFVRRFNSLPANIYDVIIPLTRAVFKTAGIIKGSIKCIKIFKK